MKQIIFGTDGLTTSVPSTDNFAVYATNESGTVYKSDSTMPKAGTVFVCQGLKNKHAIDVKGIINVECQTQMSANVSKKFTITLDGDLFGNATTTNKAGEFGVIFAKADVEASAEVRNRYTAQMSFVSGETVSTIISNFKTKVEKVLGTIIYDPDNYLVVTTGTNKLEVEIKKNLSDNSRNVDFNAIAIDDLKATKIATSGLTSIHQFTGSAGDIKELYQQCIGGKGIYYDNDGSRDLYKVSMPVLKENEPYAVVTITSKAPDATKHHGTGDNVIKLLHIVISGKEIAAKPEVPKTDTTPAVPAVPGYKPSDISDLFKKVFGLS